MSSRASIAVVLLAALLGSCGSSSTQSAPKVKSPFLASDEALFDGGVEYVDDPTKLTGRWRDDWEQEIADRVARADAVVLGEVVSTRVGTDVQGRAFIDLSLEVEKQFAGAPSKRIELRSRAQDPGHRTLVRAGDRLLGGRYVAFVKWAEDGNTVRGRFHLAYASGFVVSAVQAQLEKKK